MMRNLIRIHGVCSSQWYHHDERCQGMNKQRVIEEYDYIADRLEKERLCMMLTSVPAATPLPADDPYMTLPVTYLQQLWILHGFTTYEKHGVSPFADSAAGPSPFLSSIAGGPSPSNVSTDHIPIALLTSLPYIILVDPRVKVETVSESAFSPPRSRSKHLGVRSDDYLWDKPVEDFFIPEVRSDEDMENYIPPLHMVNSKDWEIINDERKTVYMFVGQSFIPIRQHCLERMIASTSTTCSTLVTSRCCLAGNIIQTVQAGLRQAYECLASAPIACTARQMVFSSPWLTPGKSLLTICKRLDGCQLFHLTLIVLDGASNNYVSAACIVAAGYIGNCFICDAPGSVDLAMATVPADYVPTGHVLISADRYKSADLFNILEYVIKEL
ncbi:hypothetical protein Tco_1253719 [Tanacetum coccineum]